MVCEIDKDCRLTCCPIYYVVLAHMTSRRAKVQPEGIQCSKNLKICIKLLWNNPQNEAPDTARLGTLQVSNLQNVAQCMQSSMAIPEEMHAMSSFPFKAATKNISSHQKLQF